MVRPSAPPPRVDCWVTWPARPLGSSPITGPSSLLRAGPPLCLASVLCPCGRRHLGFSLSTTRGHRHPLRLAVRIETTGSPVPCQRLQRAHATFTPDTARATCRQLPGSGPAHRARLCPGTWGQPRFRCHLEYFDASAVVQPCSSSRRLPDPLVAGLFRSRFPPRLLTDMTLRWFGISACTANPEGLPPSLAQHGSWWRSSTSSPLPFQDALPKIFQETGARNRLCPKRLRPTCRLSSNRWRPLLGWS